MTMMSLGNLLKDCWFDPTGPLFSPPAQDECAKPLQNYKDFETRLRNVINHTLADTPTSSNDLSRLSPAVLDGLVRQIWDGLSTSQNEWWTESVERSLESAVLQLVQGRPLLDSLVFHALDLVSEHVKRGLCSDVVPVNIVAAVLECQTVPDAERLFDYLEDRVSTGHFNPMANKGFILLRACNDLLRRTSKSTKTVFCGRILTFLSKVYPLGDRSGVNLRGNYNTENLTTLEAISTPELASFPMDHLDETLGPKASKFSGDISSQPLDDSIATEHSLLNLTGVASSDFYEMFWSLQDYLSNPTQLLINSNSRSRPSALRDDSSKASGVTEEVKASTDPLERLKIETEILLKAFVAANKAEKALNGPSGTEIASTSAHDSDAIDADLNARSWSNYFFPKFLTSRRLLGLQIADSYFRRQILTQLLILFHLLLSFGVGNRAYLVKVLSEQNIELKSSTLWPNFVLDENAEKWIRHVYQTIRREIEDTGIKNDGRRFLATVELILSRERHWLVWKLKSCLPAFDRPPLTPEVATILQMPDSTSVSNLAAKSYPHSVGSPQLSHLWSQSISLADASHYKQKNIRTLHRYNERIGHLLEGDHKSRATAKSVESLVWRGLRATAVDNLHFFSQVDRPSANTSANQSSTSVPPIRYQYEKVLGIMEDLMQKSNSGATEGLPASVELDPSKRNFEPHDASPTTDANFDETGAVSVDRIQFDSPIRAETEHSTDTVFVQREQPEELTSTVLKSVESDDNGIVHLKRHRDEAKDGENAPEDIEMEDVHIKRLKS